MKNRRKVFLMILGGIAAGSLLTAGYVAVRPPFGFIGFRSPVMSQQMPIGKGDMLFVGSSEKTSIAEAKVTVYSFKAPFEEVVERAKEELQQPTPQRWAKYPNQPPTFVSADRQVILTIARGKFVNDPRFYSLRHDEGFVTVSIVNFGKDGWLEGIREKLFPRKQAP